MEASQQELDRILNGDNRNAFGAQDYFSEDNNSTAHVFDVIQGNGIMRNNLDGDALRKMMKVGYLPYYSLPRFKFARFSTFLGTFTFFIIYY